MFTDPVPGRSFPTGAMAISAVAVVILLVVLVLMSRRSEAPQQPNTLLPVAAYASDLAMSNLQTYIEGHIANHGQKTVTDVTVQVVFANDVSMAPQIVTEPLNMIYMRQPYVDTRAVSASPLAPGAEGDFRLIFDQVSDNWNQQMPQIRVTQVATR
jgi:hypothetical protein